MAPRTKAAPPEVVEGRARVLPANHMRINGNDLCYRTYFIAGLPHGHSIDDLFHPYYWSLQRRLQPGDLIRVSDRDGDYDVVLKVRSVETSGGAQVEFWPRFPAAMAADAETFEETASAAGKVGDGIASNMPRVLNGQPVPRVDYTEATRWRVIALSGNAHKEGFANKAAAEKEMEAYCKRMRIPVTV